MANSYTETTSRASEIPSELIEHSIGEESEGNAENLNINSGEDLSDPDSQCGINQGTSSQNSLDVLSKLACENISETSELSTDPVEAGVHESELGNETEDDDQVYDVAAAGSSGEESGSKTNETIVTEIFEDYVCDETEQCTETNQDPSHSELVRKSGRNRRPRQLSPDGSQRSHAPKRPRTSALPKTVRAKKKNDEPFKCDLCGSAYVTDPTRRGNRPKTTAHAPSPRHKLDPESGRLLTLCNACGLSFNRPKAPRHRAVCDPEAKRLYLEEARQFAASLAEGLEEQDALRLFCPRFKTSACACLQKYILADGNMDESRQRAQQLLNLLKQSKILSKQKCYSVDEELVQTSVEGKGKRGKNIGLGNGQRKSKEFEEFVLEQRKYLRDELKLCEHGTQRVLNYSNNFLHKKLKTDPTKPFRVERQKGMAVLGKLKPIQELSSEVCCVDKCVSMTLTHSKLLQQWRDRAASGQAEARRVLAEMLTPSGGARSNCYKFISWVTGCSHSTISRVNEQMKKTGGDREPPAHGLISWWKEHPKPKKVKPKPVSHSATVSTHGVQIHHLTNAQLQALQPLGILQAAASSVGIPAALLSSNPLPANPQVITINSSHLTLSGMPATTQAQATGRQVILTPTQHTQLQIQQLQQQQQQLQMQTMQLQQQLQQQLHQEQQHIHTQNTEQNQSIQIQIPNQVISNPDAACLTLTQSHEFPSGTYTTTLHPVSQVQTVCPNNGGLGASSQSTSLSTDTFLSSDSLQILNAEQVQAAVAPHVVTFQCSNESSTTQAVPVSLIQTPVSLAL